MDVRGEHLESYPWAEPDFFTVRPAAKVMYAEFKKGPEPRTVGRHLADASDSEPEIEIVADRLAASLTSSTTAVSSSTPMSSTRRKGAGREK